MYKYINVKINIYLQTFNNSTGNQVYRCFIEYKTVIRLN